jgi:hypothetical protein
LSKHIVSQNDICSGADRASNWLNELFVGVKHLAGRIAPAFMNLTQSQEYGRQNLDEA